MEEFLRKLEDLLKDVEGVDMESIKTELQSLVDDKTEKQTLLRKNKQLLTEKRKLEGQLTELEEQVSGFDTDEFERLKGLEEEYLSKGGEQKVDLDGIKSKIELKWKNQIGLKEKEIESLKETLGNTNSKLEDMLIEQKLEENFNKGRKVLDSHREILKEYFKSKVKVETDEDDRTVYVRDATGGELPIEDFFEFWKGTPEAKQYLEADYTSGGGAQGSKGSFKTHKKAWKDMSISERVALFQENPAEYERLKNEAQKR